MQMPAPMEDKTDSKNSYKMNVENNIIKQNLRKNANTYQIYIVDSIREPRHPALFYLHKFIQGKLVEEIPDCIFALQSLEDELQEGLYFILFNNATQVIGYAWTFPDEDKPNARHVQHLCANTQKYKGGGTVLMSAILNYTRNERFQMITLDALPCAIPFYESLGFVKENPDYLIEDDELCPMIFYILFGGRRTKRTCRKRAKGYKRYTKRHTKRQ